MKNKITLFDIIQAIVAFALIAGFGFMIGVHILK